MAICNYSLIAATQIQDVDMSQVGISLSRLLVLVAALPLASCTSPYSVPQVHFAKDQVQTIVGVKQLLADAAEVDIVTIHGMCTHDGKWAKDEINQLAKQLGVAEDNDLQPIEVARSNALVYKREVHVDNSTVNIAAIVWSPILTPLKEGLCYDQSVKTGVCASGDERPDFLKEDIKSPEYVEQRATLNKAGKDSIMNDCLADAVAYQGQSREEISRQMQEAILFAALPGETTLTPEELRKEAAKRDAPLVMFTSSLGSKVGFDALDALSKIEGNDKAAARGTVRRTINIFMAANQIPILQLADQTLSIGPDKATMVGTPDDSLTRLLHQYRADVQNYRGQKRLLQSTTQPLAQPTIVVLSDPNDILSYSLRNYSHRPSYVTVDVVVSNDKTWFGLLENPLSAHRDYLVQPNISDIVVNGYQVQK
jgi:hypothetical protein